MFRANTCSSSGGQLHTGRPLTESVYTRCCINTIDLLMMSTCLLVEDLNKRIIKKNCASSWSPTRSYIEMHGQQNVKAVNMVWILNND